MTHINESPVYGTREVLESPGEVVITLVMSSVVSVRVIPEDGH